MGIASGYHTVTESHLRELGRVSALAFILDMFNCGGRIGYYEYCRWRLWINANVAV